MGNNDEMLRIPKFLKRLHREASDPANQYIKWDESGEKIQIQNKKMFIIHTLPILSKTKEYSTFIRQLNIYGFIKTKTEKQNDVEEYYNQFFKRSQPMLMDFIKRIRKYPKSTLEFTVPMLESNINRLNEYNYHLSNEIKELKEKVVKQEAMMNGLLDILGRVFNTGIQNINPNMMPISELFSENEFLTGKKYIKNTEETVLPSKSAEKPLRSIAAVSNDILDNKDSEDVKDIIDLDDMYF